MNKQELVEAIALEFPTLSKKEIGNFLKIFTSVLEKGFRQKGNVRIDGLGTIKRTPDGSPVMRFFPSFGDDSNEPQPTDEPDDSEPDEPIVAPANVTPIRKKTKK